MTLRFFTLALATLLLASHALALEFFWYWQFAWFDIFMHILGGMTIVSFLSSASPKASVFAITAIALVVGLAWEVFESAIGAAALFAGGDLVDTVTDIGAMLFGVALGIGIVRTAFL